jgi:hypothetical protein
MGDIAADDEIAPEGMPDRKLVEAVDSAERVHQRRGADLRARQELVIGVGMQMMSALSRNSSVLLWLRDPVPDSLCVSRGSKLLLGHTAAQAYLD